ncbi:MAG TPA: endonuclease/exonuclease/phosphatase family protein [Lysobacter sp.]
MSRSLLIVACLAGLLCSSLPASAQTLRVMSFNVRLPLDADGANRWEQRRELMVRTIREQDPDVIGTQELYALQGDYLVAKIPEYTWFGRGRSGKPGDDERMGVFYRRDRFRVLESGDFWLSDTPDVPGSITWGHLFPRMVTWALFERIGDSRRFYLFNTHLPYREQDDEARLRGALAILQRLRTLPDDVPVVLTGDFNTAPDGCVHKQLVALLQDAWSAAPHREGPDGSYHAFTGQPQKRIDWILFRGLRAEAARTITRQEDGRYPSDHFPVMAEFAWPTGR